VMVRRRRYRCGSEFVAGLDRLYVVLQVRDVFAKCLSHPDLGPGSRGAAAVAIGTRQLFRPSSLNRASDAFARRA